MAIPFGGGNMTDAVEAKRKAMASFWSLPIDHIDGKLATLRATIPNQSDLSLLDLLNICDLETESAINTHFDRAIEKHKADTTISRQDMRIHHLELELKRIERLLSDANETVSKLKGDLEIKTEEAKELQNQLIANEDESDRIQSRLESKLEAKEKVLKENQQQIMELQQQRENSDHYRGQFEQLNVEFTQRTEEMKNYKNQLTAQQRQVENQQALFETKVAKLNGELTAFRETVEAMTGTIKHKEDITLQLEQQIIELRLKLHAAEKVAGDKNAIIERKKHSIIEQMKRHQSSDKVQNQLALNQKSMKLKDISELMSTTEMDKNQSNSSEINQPNSEQIIIDMPKPQDVIIHMNPPLRPRSSTSPTLPPLSPLRWPLQPQFPETDQKRCCKMM